VLDGETAEVAGGSGDDEGHGGSFLTGGAGGVRRQEGATR
jgi:hypothetical protein